MKKPLLILTAVLIISYVLLSLVSSDNEYRAEKLFYRANKTYNKIKTNPDVAPPALISSVERDLQKIIENYPETEAVKSAYARLVEVYMADKKYDKAIEVLDALIARQDLDLALSSRAHFLKGLAYEGLDRWNEALKEFTTLKEKYVNTPIGLQAPLYIAQYYIRKGREDEAQEALNDAAGFYEGLEEDNRGTILGYASSNLLVQTYISLERYEEAGEVVADIIAGYPTTATFIQQLPYVELIFLKALKRPQKATEIYKHILEKAEDDRLSNFLQEKIKELEKRE